MDACFCCIHPFLPAVPAAARFASITDVLGALAKKSQKNRNEKFYKRCWTAPFAVIGETHFIFLVACEPLCVTTLTCVALKVDSLCKQHLRGKIWYLELETCWASFPRLGKFTLQPGVSGSPSRGLRTSAPDYWTTLCLSVCICEIKIRGTFLYYSWEPSLC